jgi:hypothetical protein
LHRLAVAESTSFSKLMDLGRTSVRPLVLLILVLDPDLPAERLDLDLSFVAERRAVAPHLLGTHNELEVDHR